MELLNKFGRLADTSTVETATDLLWSMLSIPTWLQLTTQCDRSEQDDVERLHIQATRTFVELLRKLLTMPGNYRQRDLHE